MWQEEYEACVDEMMMLITVRCRCACDILIQPSGAGGEGEGGRSRAQDQSTTQKVPTLDTGKGEEINRTKQQ